MSDNSVVVFLTLRGTVVIVPHAANPLAASNTSLAICSPERLNQLITDAVMIPLRMSEQRTRQSCVKDVVPERTALRTRCSSVLGRASERSELPPARGLQHATTSGSIAIANQDATISQDTVNRIRQAAHSLQRKRLVGKRSGARHVDTPRLQLDDEHCVVHH